MSEFSHGSNKCVMNLNNNEREIPKVRLEECAVKLDAKDFACQLKAKAKQQRRKLAGFSSRTVLIVQKFELMLNKGNILSPIMKYRRK